MVVGVVVFLGPTDSLTGCLLILVLVKSVIPESVVAAGGKGGVVNLVTSRLLTLELTTVGLAC